MPGRNFLPGAFKIRFMKRFFIVICSFLLVSCEEQTTWEVRYEPTTEAERQAVAEQVRAIMASTPGTLSGDDQDWDDFIEAATKSAKQTLCRPTIWERRGNRLESWTGYWKYLSEQKDENSSNK